MSKGTNIRAGIYIPAESLKDFDQEAQKHSNKLTQLTGAAVSLSRGEFIALLTAKLKSGEIQL